MKKFKITNKGRTFVVSAKDSTEACLKFNRGLGDRLSKSGMEVLKKAVSRQPGFAEYGNKLDFLPGGEVLGVRVAQPRMRSGVIPANEAREWATHLIMFAEALESLAMRAEGNNSEAMSMKDSTVGDADTSTLLGLVQDITEFVHNNFDRLKGKTLTEIQKEYERFKGQSWKQLPNAMMLASINFGW